MKALLRALLIVAAIAFALFAADQYFRHDLAGWTPDGDYSSPSTRVEATLPGAQDFSIADCVPGTVDPYGAPTPEEYSGTATVSVLSCRSKSGAITRSLSAMLFLTVAGLLVWLAVRRRAAKQ